MSNTPYRDIPGQILARVAFTGNSLRGGPRPAHVSRGLGSMTVPHDADYVIWSYATPIGYAVGETLYVTGETFSPTTSRGQGILRRLGAITV